MGLSYIDHTFRNQIYNLLNTTLLKENHFYELFWILAQSERNVCNYLLQGSLSRSPFYTILNSKAQSIYSVLSSYNFLKVFTKYQVLSVSGSTCKELGNHHSILTASKNLNRLKNQQVFLDL